MSKIGNHLVALMEPCAFWFGWKSAERGEPFPYWTPSHLEDSERLEAQQAGWNAFHEQERAQ